MPAGPPHTYDVPRTPVRLVSVSRGSKFQIDYVMSDTTGSSFRCTPEFADFVVGSWGRRTGTAGELEPDVARLIVGQVCDILNLDGGAVVVYAEVVAFVAALRRERDSWKSAYESRQSPTDVIVKQILKDVRDLTRIVRGKA